MVFAVVKQPEPKTTMTQKNRNGLLPEIKTLLSQEEDFLRPAGGVDCAASAGSRHERGHRRREARTERRAAGLPQWLLSAQADHAGWGRWSCGCRRIGRGASARRCLRAISAARRRWWRRWWRCMCRESRRGRSKRSAKSCAGTSSVRARSASSTQSWTGSWNALRGRSWSANTRTWCWMRATNGCARRG